MIATMRPEIDNDNEYVRNTNARAFAVVASALGMICFLLHYFVVADVLRVCCTGVPSLIPFLRAVAKSKKSWQVRACVCTSDGRLREC